MRKLVYSLMSLTLLAGLVTPTMAEASTLPPPDNPPGHLAFEVPSLDSGCYEGVVAMPFGAPGEQDLADCLFAAGLALAGVGLCVLGVLAAVGITAASLGVGLKLGVLIAVLACGGLRQSSMHSSSAAS